MQLSFAHFKVNKKPKYSKHLGFSVDFKSMLELTCAEQINCVFLVADIKTSMELKFRQKVNL